MGDKIKRMLQNEIQQMETQRAGNLLTGSRPLLCRRNIEDVSVTQNNLMVICDVE